jgi:hypothetical protein
MKASKIAFVVVQCAFLVLVHNYRFIFESVQLSSLLYAIYLGINIAVLLVFYRRHATGK